MLSRYKHFVAPACETALSPEWRATTTRREIPTRTLRENVAEDAGLPIARWVGHVACFDCSDQKSAALNRNGPKTIKRRVPNNGNDHHFVPAGGQRCEIMWAGSKCCRRSSWLLQKCTPRANLQETHCQTVFDAGNSVKLTQLPSFFELISRSQNKHTCPPWDRSTLGNVTALVAASGSSREAAETSRGWGPTGTTRPP